MSTIPETTAPQKPGRYEIGQLIGTDGFTSVFSAYDRKEKKNVAVKMMNREFPAGTDADAIRAAEERLDAEIGFLSDLEHPNVIGYLRGSDPDAQLRFLITENVDGITLEQYMTRGQLPIEEIIAFGEQLLAALVHIHTNEVMHLDLCPRNVLVRKNGYLKLANFGYAQTIPKKHERRLPVDVLPACTLPYASPEVAGGQYIDEKADLYSLGAILYEMTTGRTPYGAQDSSQIKQKPVAPSRLRADVPPQLESFIMYLLEHNPQKRYATALDAFHELRKLRRKPIRLVKLLPPEEINARNRDKKNHEENPPSHSITPVILGIAVAIFLVAVVSLFYAIDSLHLTGVESRSVKIPVLAGEYYTNDADLGLNQDDFVVDVQYEYSLSVEEGKIISQDPPSGSSRKAPCTMKLVVSLGPEKITVADYTVRDWRVVRSELRALGFIVSVEDIVDPYVPYGYIVSTDPAPATEVLLGSPITLYVSSGSGHRQVATPRFIGLAEDQAVEMMDECDLYLGTVTYTRSTEPVGTIIGQFPEVGASIFTGSSDAVIDFVVSGGSRFSTNYCPDVRALSVAKATELLSSFGLKTNVITVRDKAPSGTILSQTPENGGTIPASTTIVILTVSGGPDYVPETPTMPLISGIPFSDALSLITHFLTPNGITYDIEVQYVENDADYGTVLSQIPASGKRLSKHASIELVISGGPNFMPNVISVTVPSVTGFSLAGARSILENNGLKIENITYEASYQPKGTVIRQSVPSGNKLVGREGMMYIDIVVSGGPNYTP